MCRILAALVAPSRNDPGNMRYELYADPKGPRRFVLVQRWADQASYVQHDQGSDHIREFTKTHSSKLQSAEVYQLVVVA